MDGNRQGHMTRKQNRKDLQRTLKSLKKKKNLEAKEMRKDLKKSPHLRSYHEQQNQSDYEQSLGKTN